MAPVRAAQPRCRPARPLRRRSASPSTRCYDFTQGRRGPVARRRLPARAGPATSATSPTSWRGGACGPPTTDAEHGDDESAVRGRDGGDLHRAPRPTIGWPCGRSEIEGFARAAGGTARRRRRPAAPATGHATKWVAAVAEDLRSSTAAAALVLAGDRQPPRRSPAGARPERAPWQCRPDRDLHRPGRGPSRSIRPQSLRELVERHGRRARSRCWSSWAAIRSSRRRPISTSRSACRRCRCASI